jgi:hypothetical protein
MVAFGLDTTAKGQSRAVLPGGFFGVGARFWAGAFGAPMALAEFGADLFLGRWGLVSTAIAAEIYLGRSTARL